MKLDNRLRWKENDILVIIHCKNVTASQKDFKELHTLV
jgi:hypothetical protein